MGFGVWGLGVGGWGLGLRGYRLLPSQQPERVPLRPASFCYLYHESSLYNVDLESSFYYLYLESSFYHLYLESAFYHLYLESSLYHFISNRPSIVVSRIVLLLFEPRIVHSCRANVFLEGVRLTLTINGQRDWMAITQLAPSSSSSSSSSL